MNTTIGAWPKYFFPAGSPCGSGTWASAHPKPKRDGDILLRLLIDPRFAAAAAGYDTLAPRSRLVRTIENHLAERPVRFSRAAALVSISGTFDDLADLRVTLVHAESPQATGIFRPRRFYRAMYLFSQSAYERNEETIVVIIDAANLEVLSPNRAALFADLAWADLADLTDPAYQPAILPISDKDQVVRVLRIAEEAAKTRAQDVVRQRVYDKSVQFQQEKEQVERHHHAQMLLVKSKNRQKTLQEEFEKKLELLLERYTVRSELSLLSFQELLIPRVEYQLVVGQSGRRTRLKQAFYYDPLGNTISTEICKRCHGNKTSKEWCYCGKGEHLECFACKTIRTCYAPDCRSTACVEHDVPCAVCAEVGLHRS